MTKPYQTRFHGLRVQILATFLCALLLAPGDTLLQAQTAPPPPSSEQAAPKVSNDQLDSLVAPIALYPDPLLSQVLVASTYPLEIIQLQQWLQKNSTLKDDALTTAVQKQDWDASIQAMAVFPDLVKRMADNIKWTTDLGNAFLAQQSDVMDAVQRMRMKAKAGGQLKSSEQMKVETKTVETKTVVVIEPADPQVVYVPTYNPVVVYGAPIYPYPVMYYPPPPPPGYYAAAMITFGVAIAIGGYYHGGWGWGCGWGHNTYINVNIHNNYVSHYNNVHVNHYNVNRNGNNNWQHNPQHRGSVPYSNKQVAKQYGGSARGDSLSSRQATAQRQQSVGNRNTSARPSSMNNQARGANSVGNRQVSSRDYSRNQSAFSGASSRSTAHASSARGSSSMRSSSTRSSSGGRRR